MAAKKDFKKPNVAEQFISGSAKEEPALKKPTKPKTTRKASGETTGEVKRGYKLVRETKSERLQLLIRPSLKEDLKKAARVSGVSVNDLINTILEESIEGKGRNGR